MIGSLLVATVLAIVYYYFSVLPKERTIKQIQLEIQCASLSLQFFETLKKSRGWKEMDIESWGREKVENGTYACLYINPRRYSYFDAKHEECLLFLLMVWIDSSVQSGSGERYLHVYNSVTGEKINSGFFGYQDLDTDKLGDHDKNRLEETKKMLKLYMP